MIKIGKPYVEHLEGFSYLKASVNISGDAAQGWIDYSKTIISSWRLYEDYPPVCWEKPDFALYFKLEDTYQEGLCTDRADAHVVAMLYYAMASGSDIESEAPVSTKLLYSINFNIIPILCNADTGFRRIRVIANTIDVPIISKGFVGTGMSCGVDSFHTLWKHSQPDMQPDFRLTHLTYLNMGSIFHPGGLKRGEAVELFNKKVDELYDRNLENARKVAAGCGLPLVYIESNIDRDIYRGAYGFTAIYRNCAMILASQGLWKTYFNSSSGLTLDFYEPSLRVGSAHYELTLLPGFSNGTVDFLIGGGECTRFMKIRDLVNFPLAQNFLDVCFQFNNCGTCSKCYRTLLTLDILDSLDSFREVFDIEEYRRTGRAAALGYLLFRHRRDETLFEVYEKAMAKGMPIPLQARVIAMKLRVRAGISHFMKKVFPRLYKSDFVKKRKSKFV